MKSCLLACIVAVYAMCASAYAAVKVPLYFELEDAGPLETSASFCINGFPVNLGVCDLKNKFLAGDLPAKTVRDFFAALNAKDKVSVENMSLDGKSILVQKMLKKFSVSGLDFKSVRLLDVFKFNDTFKIFYEINDPKTSGKKLVSYFTFKKGLDGNYKLIIKPCDAMESLCAYSLATYYKSKSYKAFGFTQIDTEKEMPKLKFPNGFDFKKMNFLKEQPDVLGFYNAFVQARISGDVDLVTSFCSESSRRKVGELINMNVFEFGAKYKTRRQLNNTKVVGIISLAPLYVVVEQIGLKENEIRFRYTYVVKDTTGNMQIVNVFFESSFDDVLKSHKIMPQL